MLTRYITKFNTLCRLIIIGLLIYPMPIYADHVPTQAPYGLNEEIKYPVDVDSYLLISILSSDGFEDSPPEKYTIFFNVDDSTIDTSDFCVSTSFGHQTNTWQEYTFTLTALREYFELPVGTFYYRVRSDNDTDNSYSTLSNTRSITLPNQTPFSDTNNDYNSNLGCNDTSTTTTSSTTTTTTTTPTTTSTTTTTTTTSTTTTTTTTTTTLPPTTTTTLDPETIERNNNFAETGIYETNAERKAREQAEYEAEQERIRQEEKRKAEEARIENEKNNNFNETGFYETNDERAVREQKEYDDMLQRNYEETGIYETDDERIAREEAEYQAELEELARIEAEKEAEIQNELEQSILKDVDVENLSEEEKAEVKELIDVIQEIQEQDLEQYEIEEEVIVLDLPEIIIIEQEDLDEKEDTEPIKEVFEEDEFVDIIPDRQEEVGGTDNERPLEELSDEEQEQVIKQVEEKIQVVEITEDTTEEEIIEAVEALPVEEKIEVVKEVAKVSVQNLDKATEETKQIVQAVVVEVTKPETVAELTEKEIEVVAEVLGVVETNDVVIIAEQSVEDETIATAVQEYVERATENADVEDYGIQNVIVEVGIEQFIQDPIGQLTDIDLSGVVLSDIGNDMPEAVKTQAAKTVVPVIIVGQIIATPITRRF